MRIRPWLLWTTLVAQLSAWAAAVFLWDADYVPTWVTFAVWSLLALALATWNLRKRHSFWKRTHQWVCTASFVVGAIVLVTFVVATSFFGVERSDIASALVCLGAIGPSALTSLGRYAK